MGLADRYGMEPPHPGWEVMDHQTVIDELVKRSGSPDIEALEGKLAVFRETLSDLKERAISLFSMALKEENDAFLDRKLKQINSITVRIGTRSRFSLYPAAYGRGIRPLFRRGRVSHRTNRYSPFNYRRRS